MRERVVLERILKERFEVEMRIVGRFADATVLENLRAVLAKNGQTRDDCGNDQHNCYSDHPYDGRPAAEAADAPTSTLALSRALY
ncbi:MAG TPA: hypothetical protein VL635_02495 [Trinickia sp.]|nr:hypothetical protein [Trinickia sp.]